jgi:hypothetical protein
LSLPSTPPRFAIAGCGALSVPRKNFGWPETTVRSSALRSAGVFATTTLGQHGIRSVAISSNTRLAEAEWISHDIIDGKE